MRIPSQKHDSWKPGAMFKDKCLFVWLCYLNATFCIVNAIACIMNVVAALLMRSLAL
ncbi:MAG: hypothetical protein V7L01_18880 [Nostoc sp.]|uniref:hypothetical protein n=1 Tax=Nostoc sp. TaxID=1180 RepID=UPI002FF6477E